tara:strand:+ start:2409 stop:2789 length:381 start_codon:yes stop_codon:yes gene_type:complete
MLKILMSLLGKNNSGKSNLGGLAMDIREAIKGKELDPQKLIELQSEINKVEAQHRSVFVSGWRPFTGWICAVALLYNFVLRDLAIWAFGIEQVPPALQMEHLMTVLFGMLGLGGMRSLEKIKDKTR